MAETVEGKAYTDDEINAIVNERLDKDRKTRGWSPADAEELKQHRTAAKAKEVEDAKVKKDFEKAQELLTQQHTESLGKEKQRGDSILSRYRRERIANALLDAASTAINPGQVASLLRDRVAVDEDSLLSDHPQLAVLDANGQPVKGVTVGKLVADFLAENKHFVRSDSAGQHRGTAGAGGNSGADRGGEQTGPLGELAKAKAELEAADKSGDLSAVTRATTKYNRLLAQCKQAGLIS